MPIIKSRLPVTRYFVRGEFNPRSPMQLLGLMESRGHAVGTSKNSDKPSTNKKVLEALAKKDPFYQDILNHRAISKVKSTYVEGVESKLDAASRCHPKFLHKPSTLRLSCKEPNLQNVVQDREQEGEAPIAAGFRNTIVSGPDCTLWEADFGGIEAVITGYCIKDPTYIRLARLGVHAYVASHLIGKPANLKWSDEELGAYFKKLKKEHDEPYNRAKRVVHGSNYLLSPFGMVRNYPTMFNLKTATEIQELYFKLCPTLKPWHQQQQLAAHKNGFLSNRFGYKHWFWDVFTWNSTAGAYKLGTDGKRVIALEPQGTGAACLKEACLRLLEPTSPSYIGDSYFGKTPVRALIHDSIFGESETETLPSVLTKVYREMTKPIPQLPLPSEWNMGTHLSIGVVIKTGQVWADMEEYAVELGVASDTVKEWEEDNEGD